MSSYNKVILIGRVTALPEMRYTQTGKPVTSFTIAVDRPRRSEGKDRETDFISIVTWQKLAEICSRYLDKGKLICIEGRLQVRTYTTADGQKRKVYEVVASDMRMLGRPKSEGGASQDETEGHIVESGDRDLDHLGISDIGMEDDVPF
ncbi:MAG: single-stranded DNA-binding protein [Candidatus Eremiobacteraeota bacterium]|nr:single-stranded DNA-binding protein [Candidatus Eremiobacteraeota bacterium]